MSEYIWKKPVLCIFRERKVNPESDPFVVIKAKALKIKQKSPSEYLCKIEDFFTLMGDADYLSSAEGTKDHYVVCWFDDEEPDLTKDLRRLRGVTISGKVSCQTNDHNKRTYNASFKAEQAKLK